MMYVVVYILGNYCIITFMGNSASRAARKLPKRAEPPPLASNRTPNLTNRPNGVNREHVRDELASERKTEGWLLFVTT